MGSETVVIQVFTKRKRCSLRQVQPNCVQNLIKNWFGKFNSIEKNVYNKGRL